MQDDYHVYAWSYVRLRHDNYRTGLNSSIAYPKTPIKEINMKKDWIDIPVNQRDGISIKRTCVGDYMVSTVKLGPITNSLDSLINTMGEFLGADDRENPNNKSYETKVFRSQQHEDGSYHIHENYEEIDVQHYDTLEDTQKGHLVLCEKYDKEQE